MTIYTNTARFDTGRPLTEEELLRQAPSIFQTQAHSSRSERFAPIPTIEMVRGLASEGFHVVGAKQALARMPGREDFTKRLLRLRRFDGQSYAFGDTVCEMLLKNANDGTCASTIDSVRVRHSGDAMGVNLGHWFPPPWGELSSYVEGEPHVH